MVISLNQSKTLINGKQNKTNIDKNLKFPNNAFNTISNGESLNDQLQGYLKRSTAMSTIIVSRSP